MVFGLVPPFSLIVLLPLNFVFASSNFTLSTAFFKTRIRRMRRTWRIGGFVFSSAFRSLSLFLKRGLLLLLLLKGFSRLTER